MTENTPTEAETVSQDSKPNCDVTLKPVLLRVMRLLLNWHSCDASCRSEMQVLILALSRVSISCGATTAN